MIKMDDETDTTPTHSFWQLLIPCWKSNKLRINIYCDFKFNKNFT